MAPPVLKKHLLLPFIAFKKSFDFCLKTDEIEYKMTLVCVCVCRRVDLFCTPHGYRQVQGCPRGLGSLKRALRERFSSFGSTLALKNSRSNV